MGVCVLASSVRERERGRVRQRVRDVRVRASQGVLRGFGGCRMQVTQERKKEMRGSPSSPPFINSFRGWMDGANDIY